MSVPRPLPERGDLARQRGDFDRQFGGQRLKLGDPPCDPAAGDGGFQRGANAAVFCVESPMSAALRRSRVVAWRGAVPSMGGQPMLGLCWGSGMYRLAGLVLLKGT